MQLLFETTDEFDSSDGLGILQGHVRPPVSAAEVSPLRRATHIGLRQVTPENNRHLSNGFRGGAGECYSVHSFATEPQDDAGEIFAGRAHHLGEPFVAAGEAGNVLGVQFHPERSGESGPNLLAGIFGAGSGP